MVDLSLNKFWKGFSGQSSYNPQDDYKQFKGDMYNASLGLAPSAAQAQLQSGKSQAQAAAASQAASARGNTGQRAAAQQAATFGAAAATQQAANQAAVLRAQEQAAARQTLADYIGREQQANASMAQSNAANAQKGYGVIGAVAGGLLSSDMRSKEQIQPAVSLMPTMSQSIEDRKRAEDAAAMQQQPAMYGGGQQKSGGILGSVLSDERAKNLETENAGLKEQLKSLVMPQPKQAARQMQQRAPVASGSYYHPEFKNEAELREEEARFHLESRDALNKERAAQMKDASQSEFARLLADYEARKLRYEDSRRSPGLLQPSKGSGLEPSPDYPPPPEGSVDPAVGEIRLPRKHVVSDERAKELSRELDAVRDTQLRGMGADPGVTSGDLDRVRDEQLSGMSGVPTARFDDVGPTAEQSRANLAPMKPFEFSYKPEFAAQQGTDTEPRLGIMAQDALKSPSYQSAVVERPDGMLGLDKDRLLQANTAELAGVDKRLRELEALRQDALRRNTPPERR